jgi:polyphenol oxidase
VLGPCIHPECYEFSPADLDPIAARLGPEVAGETAGGQLALDLPVAVALALSEAGVDDITDIGICTACSADHFSHRRDGSVHGVTGLQTMLVAAR